MLIFLQNIDTWHRGMRRSTWIVEENNVTVQREDNTRLTAPALAMGWWEKFITAHKVMLRPANQSPVLD